MTLQELKDFLGTLSEEQLKQEAFFFQDDETDGVKIDSWDVSGEDFYWERHGDCLGNLEQAKAYIESSGEKWADQDLVIIPSGTVTFHSA